MQLTKSLFLGMTSILVLASPASAHNGEHTASFISNALHWLSSPSHALFSVIATMVILTIAHKIMRKHSA